MKCDDKGVLARLAALLDGIAEGRFINEVRSESSNTKSRSLVSTSDHAPVGFRQAGAVCKVSDGLVPGSRLLMAYANIRLQTVGPRSVYSQEVPSALAWSVTSVTHSCFSTAAVKSLRRKLPLIGGPLPLLLRLSSATVDHSFRWGCGSLRAPDAELDANLQRSSATNRRPNAGSPPYASRNALIAYACSRSRRETGSLVQAWNARCRERQKRAGQPKR